MDIEEESDNHEADISCFVQDIPMAVPLYSPVPYLRLQVIQALEHKGISPMFFANDAEG